MKSQMKQRHKQTMAVQPLTINPTEKGTMKSQIRIAALFVLTALGLALATTPASAQGIGLLYDNGPYSSPRLSPIRISQQYVVSNEVQMKDNGILGKSHYMNSFQFVAWVRAWDAVRCVDWSIDTQPFGALHTVTPANHHYGGGTACPPNDLSAVYLFQQESPKGSGIFWDIYEVTISFPDVKLPPETLDGCPSCTLGAPTFYLTLKNTPVGGSVYMYWDVNKATGALGNNGKGAGSTNTAYVCNTSPTGPCNVGTANVTAISSESFSIMGYDQ